MATITKTKKRTIGLLKKLAFAAALSAGSLAQAGVLTFEAERDTPITFSGEHSEFGDYWVESYRDLNADDPAGFIIDGADKSASGACQIYACPSNNASKYYAAVNDGYLYFGLNSKLNFHVKSLQASFMSVGQLSFPNVAGLLILQGFDSNNQAVGPRAQINLPKPDSQGQSNFITYDLGLFSQNTYSAIRVLGYACDTGGCFRNTNLANIAIDNIETITVPEPASLGLIGLGLLGLGAFTRRRKA